MKTKMTLIRPGHAAIAAALALTATGAYAQDASAPQPGTIMLPEPAPATAADTPVVSPAPTIVVPEATTVAEAEPAQQSPARPASIERQTAPQRAAAVPAAMRRQTAPASVTATAADPALDPLDASQAAPVEIAPAEEPAQAAAIAAPDAERADVSEGLAQILAGLLVAGAAVGGLALLIRRRRRSREDLVPVVERPIVREPAPLPPRDEVSVPAPAAPGAFTPPVAPSAGHGAVALPAVAPSDPVARGELLKRMIAAPPDRANPFRSPKARLRRARLILQSLGRRFDHGAPRFDLGGYGRPVTV